MAPFVRYTAEASILVQLLTMVFTATVLASREVPPGRLVLRDALAVETAVNVVQLAVYLVMVYRVALSRWTTVRYYDWFVTTPLMLWTMAVYLEYLRRKERGQVDDGLRFLDAVSARDIALICGANALMLLFGFLGETGRMDKYAAVALGFLCMGIAFRVMYTRYAAHSARGRQLFAYMLSLWAMYGVAYLLPTAQKNAAFNVLDVFAKNFFSVFLSYQLVAQ